MSEKWVISQIWKDILFINFKVHPDIVRAVLPAPLELDTFKGDAFLSVVPFRMEGVRFPFTTTLPFSSLWELNLRTYVSVNGRRGIYFFTLDTDHLLAQWIAKTFFYLPYRFRPMRARVENKEYDFVAKDSLDIKAKISEIPLLISEYNEWLVERYSLFTVKKSPEGNQLWRGDVVHRPWSLNYCELKIKEEGLCREFFKTGDIELDSSFYALELPVYFKPFKRML